MLDKLYGVVNRYLLITVEVSETTTNCYYSEQIYKHFLSYEYISVMKKDNKVDNNVIS